MKKQNEKEAEMWVSWKFMFTGLHITKFYAEFLSHNGYVQQEAKMYVNQLLKAANNWYNNLHRSAPKELMQMQNEYLENNAAYTIDFVLLAARIPPSIAPEIYDEFKALVADKIKQHIQDQEKNKQL